MEVFTRWTDKARVYGCATHRRKGPSICGNAAVIEMGTADAAVLAVVEQALDPELLSAVVDRTAEKLAGQANRRAQLEAQLADVEAQIRRGTTAIITGGGEVTHLVEALRGLETERQRLDRELKARSATFDRAKLRQALEKHAKDWRAMLRRRAEKARAILRKFVAERFVFTPNAAGGYLFRGRRSRPTTSNGVPNGIRTRVLALKGPRPGPLDDGDTRARRAPPGGHPDPPDHSTCARKPTRTRHPPRQQTSRAVEVGAATNVPLAGLTARRRPILQR